MLGGSAAAGKSTSGGRVAQRLGLQCVSADSVWKALQSSTTPATSPAFHHFEPPPEVMAMGPKHLANLHVEAAEAMTPALDAFLDWELHEGHRFVFEGAWITPELAARRCGASAEERAVFIHEPLEAGILAAMLKRSGRTEPSARQLMVGGMSWRYGNWLKEGAGKRGLPVVSARPRQTLVDRIIAAAVQEGRIECDQT
jgi:2-phosphoglycerate kinase